MGCFGCAPSATLRSMRALISANCSSGTLPPRHAFGVPGAALAEVAASSGGARLIARFVEPRKTGGASVGGGAIGPGARWVDGRTGIGSGVGKGPGALWVEGRIDGGGNSICPGMPVGCPGLHVGLGLSGNAIPADFR